jgi:hypothetical protein
MNLLAAPALPLHSAGKYVAGAYIVFIAMLLIYVSIMALRLKRTERDLQALHREVAERDAAHDAVREPEHIQ